MTDASSQALKDERTRGRQSTPDATPELPGYMQGGLEAKYQILKKCRHCDGTGEGPCTCPGRGVGECLTVAGHPCEHCGGTGYVPTDPDAKYFVLRYDSDPNAQEAVFAYADSVNDCNPQLAQDLVAKLQGLGVVRSEKSGVMFLRDIFSAIFVSQWLTRHWRTFETDFVGGQWCIRAAKPDLDAVTDAMGEVLAKSMTAPPSP